MRKSTFLVALLTVFNVALFAANCDPIDLTWLKTSQTDLGEMTTDNSAVWSYDATYHYAKATKSGGVTAWLLTPSQDLTDVDAVTFSFTHVHRYAGTPANELTLWVTSDYKGDVESSTWQQLTISPYASNDNWKDWKDVTISVPTSAVGTKTVFGFKYMSTSSNYATWEIKNVRLSATFDCETEAGQLRVCGQNLLNYYYNYESCSRPKYHDAAGFAKKTNAIVNAVITINADVYAFCELEAKPIILKQLVDSLNKRVGKTRYAYVVETIDEDPESYTSANNLKSGFVYRADKVRTIGESSAASTANYYKNVMRVQAFEDIASGERFVLSMNHFKAKDSSEDQGNSKRVLSAESLIKALKKVSVDPDILVMGDFNCTKGEEPITMIINAGYEEQLLRFSETAWSYCYSSDPQLIDHVFANASMAKQVVNGKVLHTCTTCNGNGGNSSTSYSDHDPYYVDLQLASSGECEDLDVTYLQTGSGSLGEMQTPKINSDTYNNWKYDTSYGAYCNSKGNPHWLATPVFDWSDAKSVSIDFEHTIGYGNVGNMTNEHTLWITPDYSDVANSQWTQLTIPKYPTGKNWTYVKAQIDVPTSLLGKHTVIAFKNDVASDAENTPKWEIKNLHIKAVCGDITTLQNAVESNTNNAIRLIENGRLIILLPDGSIYDMRGTRLQ